MLNWGCNLLTTVSLVNPSSWIAQFEVITGSTMVNHGKPNIEPFPLSALFSLSGTIWDDVIFGPPLHACWHGRCWMWMARLTIRDSSPLLSVFFCQATAWYGLSWWDLASLQSNLVSETPEWYRLRDDFCNGSAPMLCLGYLGRGHRLLWYLVLFVRSQLASPWLKNGLRVYKMITLKHDAWEKIFLCLRMGYNRQVPKWLSW